MPNRRRARVYDIPEPARRRGDTPAQPRPDRLLPRIAWGWNEIRQRPQPGDSAEGLLAYIMASMGLVLWLPFDTFRHASIYRIMADTSIPEWTWGMGFCIPATYHLVLWLTREKYRLFTLSILIAQWVFVMIFSMAALAPSAVWLTYPVYVAVLVWRYRLLLRSFGGGT